MQASLDLRLGLPLVRRLFGLLLVLKVADLVDRDPGTYRLGWTLTLLMLAAGLCLVFNVLNRVACLAVAIIVVAMLQLSDHAVWNHHLYLAGLIGFVLGVFDEHYQPLLLKWQLSVLYGFAAISKINGTYFSGAVIERAPKSPVWDAVVPSIDVYPVLSYLAVATELFLTFAFWSRLTRRYAVVVGVIFHLTLVVGLSPRLDAVVRLAVFAGLTMILYIPFFLPAKTQRAGDLGSSPESPVLRRIR